MLSFLDVLFDFHSLFSLGCLLKYFSIILVVQQTIQILQNMCLKDFALYSELENEKKIYLKIVLEKSIL